MANRFSSLVLTPSTDNSCLECCFKDLCLGMERLSDWPGHATRGSIHGICKVWIKLWFKILQLLAGSKSKSQTVITQVNLIKNPLYCQWRKREQCLVKIIKWYLKCICFVMGRWTLEEGSAIKKGTEGRDSR